MTLLDDLGLSKLIADTAGDLLFSDIRIFRTSSSVSDGRGGYQRGREIVTAKGIITEYSEFMRAVGGIPLDARRLIIQGEGLVNPPAPEDLVELDLTGWIIREIKAVPSQAIYECLVVPTDLSLAAGLVALSITSALTADDATLIAAATSNSARALTMNATAADAWGNLVAVNPLKASASMTGDNASSSAGANNPIKINFGGVADNATMSGQTVGPIGASMTQQAEAATINARIGSGNLINAVMTADNATITADLDNPSDLSGNPQAADATIAASANNPIGASMAINVDNATLAASIFLPNDVVAVVNAADATLSANVVMPLGVSSTIQGGDATLSAALNNPTKISMTINAGDGTVTAGTNNPVKPSASLTAADATISATATVVSGGAGNEAETDALLARMTTAPTSTRELAINNLVKALKTAGIWSKLDLLYVFAAHDAQASLLNWISSSYDATNNSSTFSADWGYGESTGNSPDNASGLSTGWNDQVDGVNYTDTSMHIGVWGRASPSREYFKMGATELQAGGTLITGDNAPNFGGNISISSSGTNSLDDHKLMTGNFGGDNLGRFYHAGVDADATPVTITSGLLENASMNLITKFNASGDNAGVRIFHLGAELTAAEVSDLYDAFKIYLGSIAVEADFNAIEAAYTGTPPSGRDGAMLNLVGELERSGAWSQLDWLSVVNFDDQASRLNLIAPAGKALVDFGTPTIVPDSHFDQGFTPAGSDGFEGLVDVTSNGAGLADFCFGAYWLKLDEIGVSRDIRVGDNNTWIRTDLVPPQTRLTSTTLTTTITHGVNDAWSISLVHADTGGTGRRAFVNGALDVTASGTGGSLSGDAEFGADNQTADSHHGAYWSGRALTDAQALSLHSAVSTYLTAIGAI